MTGLFRRESPEICVKITRIKPTPLLSPEVSDALKFQGAAVPAVGQERQQQQQQQQSDEARLLQQQVHTCFHFASRQLHCVPVTLHQVLELQRRKTQLEEEQKVRVICELIVVLVFSDFNLRCRHF